MNYSEKNYRKFAAFSLEFAKFMRSIEKFIRAERTAKGPNNLNANSKKMIGIQKPTETGQIFFSDLYLYSLEKISEQ